VPAGCGLGRHSAERLDEAAHILPEVPSGRAREPGPGPAAVGNRGSGWTPCWSPSAPSTRPVTTETSYPRCAYVVHTNAMAYAGAARNLLSSPDEQAL
jgi:hypothetical protein